LFKRNVEQELATYDIEESSPFNGLILLIILYFMPKCSMNQIACALYLVRFSKILSKLLNKEEEIEFLKIVPGWELGNLDAMLVPYINQKYDTRFIRGIKELYAKGLIQIEGDSVQLISSIEFSSDNETIKRIQIKAYYASLVVMRTNVVQLNEQISRIVGEEQWGNFSSSTVSQ
jgi:hypothetical protein